jgi:hypothetical protein
MNNIRNHYLIPGTLSFIALAQCAKLLTVSYIAGSYAAFFSVNNGILPLSGAFLGIIGATCVMLGKGALTLLAGGSFSSLHYLAYHVPGLVAAYYWASPSGMVRLGVPLAAMLLFIMHPVGGVAWVYAMYWWIPIIIYASRTHGIFWQALGSTFAAHAVGSVIWLYTVPMTAAAWIALMPLVVVERGIFALTMMIGYHLISNGSTVGKYFWRLHFQRA